MKNTRFLFVILAVLLCATAVTGMLSCRPNEHTHTPTTEVKYDDNQHWNTCSGCDEMINKEDHSAEKQEWNEDEHWYLCEKCGAEFDKAAHTKGKIKSNNAEHWYECADCGATFGKEAHKKSERKSDATHHWYECTECDAIIEKSEHSPKPSIYSDATQHWQVCDKCDAAYNKADHVKGELQNDGKNHFYPCTECGEKLENSEHTLSEIKTDATHHWRECTECGALGEKTAHVWDGGKVTTAAGIGVKEEKIVSCTGCAETKTEYGESITEAWEVDAATGNFLVKTEYNENGDVLFRRYYNVLNTYYSMYSFGSMTEIMYEEYTYEGGKLAYSTMYGYENEMNLSQDVFPMTELYKTIYEYNDGKIVRADVLVNGTKTRSYDLYEYDSNGNLIRIDSYEFSELYISTEYKNGVITKITVEGEECTPKFDEKYNMKYIDHPTATYTIYYKDGMPFELEMDVLGTKVTVVYTYQNGELKQSELFVNKEKRFVATYSRSSILNELAMMGYMVINEEETLICVDSRTYNEGGKVAEHYLLIYNSNNLDEFVENTVTYAYNEKGICENLTAVMTQNGSIEPVSTEEYIYNEDGKMTVVLLVYNGESMTCATEYYENGNIRRETIDYAGVLIVAEYDERGIMTSYVDENGARYEYITYDIIFDTNYRFGRYYADDSVYSYATRIEDEEGTYTCVYDDDYLAMIETYVSADGLYEEEHEYYAGGVIKLSEYKEYEMVEGKKTFSAHTRYNYDRNGEVCDSIDYDEDRKVIGKTVYESGGVISQMEYEYRENGTTYMAREIVYNDDGSWTVTEYNEQGECVSVTKYDADGNEII